MSPSPSYPPADVQGIVLHKGRREARWGCGTWWSFAGYVPTTVLRCTCVPVRACSSRCRALRDIQRDYPHVTERQVKLMHLDVCSFK